MSIKATRAAYRRSPEGKAAQRRATEKWVRNNPEKAKLLSQLRANRYAATEKGAAQREAYRTSPEGRLSALRSHYRTNYGIELEDYVAMVEARNGLCDICHKPDLKHKLVVDHDHATGKNRGLICRKCNSGLGQFGDAVDVLLSAVAYLRKHAI